MSPRWVRVAAPLLCLAGIGVAAYLTIAHYNAKVILACPETGLVNCAKVTESPQSVILGVPVALLGLLFFVAIAPLHLPAAWRSKSALVRRARVVGAVGGILMVLYLVYTELFTLDALCLWCTAVHGITFLLFAVTLVGTMQTAETQPT
ncbi:MAG TPA: vitamin K epoxide reductase family protein [Actinomycetota bacterium]|nr:vitamin K epoxide reductase family protein [Actinomycetota bacterium]